MIEKKRILVVDDEVNICRVLEARLSKSGYDVNCVYSTDNAVKEIRENEYDLIVLDIGIPVDESLFALRRIHEIRSKTNIITMTAYQVQEVSSKALALGADMCITKPFDLENLAAFIEALLEKRSLPENMGQLNMDFPIFLDKGLEIVLEAKLGEITGRVNASVIGTDDRSVTLAYQPIAKDKASPPIGSQVSVFFVGVDGLYSFESTVMCLRDINRPTITVTKPSVIYRTQRRKDCRLNVHLPVDLVVGENPLMRVRTDNVSMGGMRIILSDSIPAGTQVQVQALHLTNGSISTTGKVAYSRKLSIDGDWAHGIAFGEVDECTGDKLSEMVGMLG